MKAVVLISGGMDSLVSTAIAIRDGYEIAGLHLNYGQRTDIKELDCFEKICAHFNIHEKLIVDVSHLARIGGSSLTDKHIAVSKADLNSKEIPSSYVPFRNANILSCAVSWAEIIDAKRIYIGAVEEDSSGYPDCRMEFYEAFNVMIKLGTKPTTTIRIITPVIEMKKSEIVLLGNDLQVPFQLSWSCYTENDIACGVCDSCALRLRAFREAGVEDPIPYKTKPIYT